MSYVQCHSSRLPLTVFRRILNMNFIFAILSWSLLCDAVLGHYSDPATNSFRVSELNDVIENNASDSSHKARLGIPLTYGSDLQGYGVNSPVKIELGGVFLGTLLGLGVALLAPKVAHIFSPAPHSYYSNAYSRSEEGSVSGITRLLQKVEQTLEENHINSIECLERAACSYMQMSSGQSRLEDSSYSFINFIIDGSKLRQALKRGENGENCSAAYPGCKFSKNMFYSGLSAMLGNNSL